MYEKSLTKTMFLGVFKATNIASKNNKWNLIGPTTFEWS